MINSRTCNLFNLCFSPSIFATHSVENYVINRSRERKMQKNGVIRLVFVIHFWSAACTLVSFWHRWWISISNLNVLHISLSFGTNSRSCLFVFSLALPLQFIVKMEEQWAKYEWQHFQVEKKKEKVQTLAKDETNKHFFLLQWNMMFVLIFLHDFFMD